MSRCVFYRTRAGDAVDRIAAKLGGMKNMRRLADAAGVPCRTASSWQDPSRLKQLKGVLSLLFAAGVTGEEITNLIGGAK